MSGCGIIAVIIVVIIILALFYYLSTTANWTNKPDAQVLEQFRRYGWRNPYWYFNRYPWTRNYWYPGYWRSYGYHDYYPFY